MTPPRTELDQRYSVEGAEPTPWSAAADLLGSARIAHLATLRPDGPPHLTPLIFVWVDDRLLVHTGPEEPSRETVLLPGELITAITVPAGPWTRRSVYVKVRDRESYAYGLATAAVALDLRDGVVNEARIGLGAVSYKPLRAHSAENFLRGKRLDELTAAAAAHTAFLGAQPRRDNAYKVELGQRTLVRALMQASLLPA